MCLCFFLIVFDTCLLPELLTEQVALQQQQLKMQQMPHDQMQETHNLTQMLHENLNGHIQSQDNQTSQTSTLPTVDTPNNQTEQSPPEAAASGGSGSGNLEHVPIGTAAKAEHAVSIF